MQYTARGRTIILFCATSYLSWFSPDLARGQEAQDSVISTAPAERRQNDIETLVASVRQLENQVQGLNSRIGELRAEQQSARLEIIALRKKLDGMDVAAASPDFREVQVPAGSTSSHVASEASRVPAALRTFSSQSTQNSEERISSLEEELQLANHKINEHNQTKVESGSKYSLRLSGIVLFNLFSNRGSLDNVDFAEFATARSALDSGTSFGGSLRQSQITLQTFGPDIAGAHTSADLRFDFAGGFSSTSNGTTMGIVRLRTGTVRFEWAGTSIVAGQDNLFISPLTPTSLASLAIPALSYSGNLWAWTPQVRVEHRVAISESSNVLLQAGILSSVSGEVTDSTFDRSPTQGEQSGQPAYAARIALSKRRFGQELRAGIGGYYSRQGLGFGRRVNGWVGSADLLLTLGKQFEFSGEFYRGRAVGGFGGAIGQSVLLKGPLSNPNNAVRGLDSMGGWVQLKFKATPKFEINTAFGDDSPFTSQLRLFHVFQPQSDSSLSRNLSPFVNFIYQPRSDVVFSTEYRWLKTTMLNSNPAVANLINFSVGYVF